MQLVKLKRKRKALIHYCISATAAIVKYLINKKLRVNVLYIPVILKYPLTTKFLYILKIYILTSFL